METLHITGNIPLSGVLTVPAAKNSLLPLTAAAAMAEGRTRFFDCPHLSDVNYALSILRALGLSADWAGEDIVISGGPPAGVSVPHEAMSAMRGSLMFLGALRGARGRVTAGMPGGCRISARPIDLHLEVFSALGASVELSDGIISLSAPNGLRGADIQLRMPSVGATENAMLAACRARGTTLLRGAAQEPEIRDLAHYLNLCGADIHGAGSPLIEITGVEGLTGPDFQPMADRITAATWVAAVGTAGGSATLRNAPTRDMSAFLSVCSDMGLELLSQQDRLYVRRSCRLRAPDQTVRTGPFPGFPTDCAPLLAAMLATAAGGSRIEDRMFENRFACCAGFQGLGAQTRCFGRVLEITGGSRLRGAPVQALDLRGGAALTVLALAAEGESALSGVEYIDRGYQHIEKQLSALGADVVRVQEQARLPQAEYGEL